MKKIISIAVVILTACIIAACGRSNLTADICIAETSWYEFGKKELGVTEYTAKENDKYTYEYSTSGVTFTVKDIEDDYILIKSSIPMSGSTDPKDGVDLHSDQQEYMIKKGETWYLHTLSQDAGKVFDITVKDIR